MRLINHTALVNIVTSVLLRHISRVLLIMAEGGGDDNIKLSGEKREEEGREGKGSNVGDGGATQSKSRAGKSVRYNVCIQ